MSAEDRFWSYVQPTDDPDGCWEWTGTFDRDGYGKLYVSGRTVRPHRFAYELLVGPFPEGLVTDHLCRNTKCVNPAHLEPVTSRVNNQRGTSPSAVNGRKTHCVHGHEFTPENTYISSKGGRCCRACNRRRVSAFNRRRKEGVLA